MIFSVILDRICKEEQEVLGDLVESFKNGSEDHYQVITESYMHNLTLALNIDKGLRDYFTEAILSPLCKIGAFGDKGQIPYFTSLRKLGSTFND